MYIYMKFTEKFHGGVYVLKITVSADSHCHLPFMPRDTVLYLLYHSPLGCDDLWWPWIRRSTSFVHIVYLRGFIHQTMCCQCLTQQSEVVVNHLLIHGVHLNVNSAVALLQ